MRIIDHPNGRKILAVAVLVGGGLVAGGSLALISGSDDVSAQAASDAPALSVLERAPDSPSDQIPVGLADTNLIRPDTARLAGSDSVARYYVARGVTNDICVVFLGAAGDVGTSCGGRIDDKSGASWPVGLFRGVGATEPTIAIVVPDGYSAADGAPVTRNVFVQHGASRTSVQFKDAGSGVADVPLASILAGWRAASSN